MQQPSDPEATLGRTLRAILGQDGPVRLLRRAVATARAASAYLFFGPPGVGKHMVAGAFCRALLCPRGAELGDACGRCPACTRSRAGSHPGLIEVARLPGRTRILLEQVHKLGASISLRPVEGTRTVAVMREAERLVPEGANAMLRILEEPPAGVTLVLLTAEREVILETIRSRCQMVRFRPLSREIVRRILDDRGGLEAGDADFLSEVCSGSVSLALGIHEMGLTRETWEALSSPRSDPPGEKGLSDVWIEVAHAGTLPERRARTELLLRLLLERIHAELPETLAQEDGRPRRAGLRKTAKAIVNAHRQLYLNVDPERVLRSLGVQWAGGGV